MAGNTYAKGTTVSAEGSRGQIERDLAKYGANSFGYLRQAGVAIIVFELQGRHMKFTLPLPPDKARTSKEADAIAREDRRRWRALYLSIKAKLVTVAEGISTVETEFMGHIVMPNGETVAEWLHPSLESGYSKGKMPPLIGA